VSDTIDAMTTDRPYRKRLTVEAVLMELQKYKETQFDPTIVDLVVSSVNIRRLISEPFTAAAYPEVPSMRSKRVSWSTSKLWPARQA